MFSESVQEIHLYTLEKYRRDTYPIADGIVKNNVERMNHNQKYVTTA